jgi:UDP-N-acetylmuramate dehydrogenase
LSTDHVTRATALLKAACGDRVRVSHPMAPLTTFRIGGPAALFLEPETDADLEAASRALAETALPFVILGKGSNVLVADDGFPGLVLRLGRGFRWVARDEDRLRAGGAMPLPALSGAALQHGLGGLEFGVAIPASIGGAVRMNAGAHHHEMAEVVEDVELWRLLEGGSGSVPAAGLGFEYRRTALPPDAVVTAATVRLIPGDPPAIRAEMDAARRWRRATQPLAEPNCGSVFKNPPDGSSAAQLIEEVGGKGLRVGGASVSSKHANFIVASEGTTSGDVRDLIDRVVELVWDRSGVRLETEVQFVGKVAHASA